MILFRILSIAAMLLSLLLMIGGITNSIHLPHDEKNPVDWFTMFIAVGIGMFGLMANQEARK